jgi:ATP-dependent Lhr-like helicase
LALKDSNYYFSKWFKNRKWKAFQFQKEMLESYFEGYSGILNAPTGSGKTFATWLPILIHNLVNPTQKKGLKVLWITPVRALVNDIKIAMTEAANEMEICWEIASRTGDTQQKEKNKQRKSPPDCLITTPESVQILMCQKEYEKYFENLQVVVVDEWHELMGNKRGVSVELSLSRLKGINQNIKIWGISATIGNLEQALDVLIPSHFTKRKIVKAEIDKKVEVNSIIPEQIETFPWGGHLGVKLLPKVLPVIKKSKTTLLFTNTRAQAEIWYNALMENAPELAGLVGLHHGSLSNEIRTWVENALHSETLKLVVCTSSLDLGVDFRPVDTIIQVGGPKGVSRFVQRAGRSGHKPGAKSIIYFVPTHSLELIEAAALREAIANNIMEERIPVVRAFDVLIQYLVTLAVAGGFDPKQIFKEIKNTHAYNSIENDEWKEILQFITVGGNSLSAYPEFHKVTIEDNIFMVNSKKISTIHRLNIGTIIGDNMMRVKFLNGSFVGTLEEYFATKLNVGDVFMFGGRRLELVMIRGMDVVVRKSEKKTTLVPQYMGGRMPFSSQISMMIRKKIMEAQTWNDNLDVEIKVLKPLFEKQNQISLLPKDDELLMEYFEDREGHHLFCYTFEGRNVNEGLAALVSFRICKIKPSTFSISMSDYGFELLSDEKFPIEEALEQDLFSSENLINDILSGLNHSEMARRKFRDIAHIAGLISSGYPGKQVKNKHLQASARNFFDVFRDYEPNHLLFKQAYEEVLFDQLDEIRLRAALKRINEQKIKLLHIEKPSPFGFPIMVERIREKLTNETLEQRVEKMLNKINS